jgi:hypothetical protein
VAMKNKSYVHIYVPPELRDRIEKVHNKMLSRTMGIDVKLTELTRHALTLGIECMEKELGIKS